MRRLCIVSLSVGRFLSSMFDCSSPPRITFQSHLYLHCIFTCSSLSKGLSLLLFHAFLLFFRPSEKRLHVCSFSTKQKFRHESRVSQEKHQNFKRQNQKHFEQSSVATESFLSVFGVCCVFDLSWVRSSHRVKEQSLFIVLSFTLSLSFISLLILSLFLPPAFIC